MLSIPISRTFLFSLSDRFTFNLILSLYSMLGGALPGLVLAGAPGGGDRQGIPPDPVILLLDLCALDCLSSPRTTVTRTNFHF